LILNSEKSISDTLSVCLTFASLLPLLPFSKETPLRSLLCMAQGPVLIFDKSSLESLSLDEAVLLDGELVALGPDGRPDFHLLQRQKSLGELPVCHAFLRFSHAFLCGAFLATRRTRTIR
jgi:hypothetical protein